MKVYEVTFSDPVRGFIRRWRRNKKQVAELIADWKENYPLRAVVTNQSVDIPADKTKFIDWLNHNATRNP